MRLVEFLKETEDVYQTYDLVGDKVSALPVGASIEGHSFDVTKLINDVESELNKKGFKKVGKGAYSRVFGKDGVDYVIKITSGKRLECTKAYIKLSRYGNINRHLPRVLKFKVYNTHKTHRDFMVTALERLYEFDPGMIRLTKDKKYNAGFLSFLSYRFELHDIIDLLYQNEIIKDRADAVGLIVNRSKALTPKYLASKIESDLGSWISEVFGPLENRWLEDYSHTPFVKAYLLIQDLYEKTPNCGLDMYQRNFLMRKDGTLVFSDPVFN